MAPDRTPSRRTVLKTTGFALASTSLAGCVSSALPQSDTGTTETPTETGAETGGTVTVMVGPDEQLTFEPAMLTVLPGTTVRWVWESDTHNIAVQDQPEGADWQGTPGPTSKVYDAGYGYERTFTSLGTFEYYCVPHEAAGMTGEVTVAEMSAKTETARCETEATTGGNEETEVRDARGRSEVTVEVGPGGELVFDPKVVRISPETTVTWVWESDMHNIVPENQPEGTDWTGTEGDATYDEGHTYTHTFTTTGTFDYFCRPHEAVEMTGTVLVE